MGNNPTTRVDPRGLKPLYPDNPQLGLAQQIVTSRVPADWTTNLIMTSDQQFWIDQEGGGPPLAGVTQWKRSWVNTARLDLIPNPDYRLFKYIETMAHELYHQNNGVWNNSEEAATSYGREFLDKFIKNDCRNKQLKQKYQRYLNEYQLMESTWGTSWDEINNPIDAPETLTLPTDKDGNILMESP